MLDLLSMRGTLADLPTEPLRAGFGRGLLRVGTLDSRVVALCADLTESTMMSLFAEAFPSRFVEVGIAEQNLVTVAAGMARAGKVPFTSSYAAFSPGRNWEQIKTTAALNDMPVIVVGSHAGVNVGPDGATHQMLEDIALMRVMPNMVVIAPADAIEAEKATVALASIGKPAYLRLARDATPVFTTAESPFEVGPAYRIHEGTDVSLIATGTMTFEALLAATLLQVRGISVDVIHVPTVKPLDEATVLASAGRTGLVVTVEEAQIAGGLGGAVAELLSSRLPTRVLRLGVEDRYGESGTPRELLHAFGLTGEQIAERVKSFVHSFKGL